VTVSAITKQINETNYFNVDNISMSTESDYVQQLSLKIVSADSEREQN